MADPGATMPWWNLPADAEVDWLTWANAVPLCRDLGLVCRELESTSAVFRMERPPLTPNPNGAASGAIVAAAADWVMGAFVRRISDHDQLPGTSSLHIQFHLPALAPLTFRVAPLGGGRRTKFVEVVVEDRDGNRCATSQATIIAGGSPTGPLPNG